MLLKQLFWSVQYEMGVGQVILQRVRKISLGNRGKREGKRCAYSGRVLVWLCTLAGLPQGYFGAKYHSKVSTACSQP